MKATRQSLLSESQHWLSYLDILIGIPFEFAFSFYTNAKVSQRMWKICETQFSQEPWYSIM